VARPRRLSPPTSHPPFRPAARCTSLLIGTQWPGLDAATDTQDAADADLMDAMSTGSSSNSLPGQKVIPDEASGYQLLGATFTTATITLRKGLVFSNGDPVTAADVAWSINRDLLPRYGNIGDVNFPVKPVNVTSSGRYEVIAHLTQTRLGIRRRLPRRGTQLDR
jgi:ABC-type transport system substrate-binding protein